jgi:hypothetical protein
MVAIERWRPGDMAGRDWQDQERPELTAVCSRPSVFLLRGQVRPETNGKSLDSMG